MCMMVSRLRSFKTCVLTSSWQNLSHQLLDNFVLHNARASKKHSVYKRCPRDRSRHAHTRASKNFRNAEVIITVSFPPAAPSQLFSTQRLIVCARVRASSHRLHTATRAHHRVCGKNHGAVGHRLFDEVPQESSGVRIEACHTIILLKVTKIIMLDGHDVLCVRDFIIRMEDLSKETTWPISDSSHYLETVYHVFVTSLLTLNLVAT